MIHSQPFVSNLDAKCIQPNAVDIRVSEVFAFTSHSFTLNEDVTIHRKQALLPGPCWHLTTGRYQFATEHYVEVPEGVAGLIIPRSSLNRNGIIVTSGLWDSGFKGYLGGTIHVPEGCVFELTANTRIGQFITWSSQSQGTYAGGYNQEKARG